MFSGIRSKISGGTREAAAYWKKLGPGLTTGAADDDPSGIATYSETGASGGFHFLWLAAWTFPLMAVIQEMCARIGLATGRGLAANIRAHYPRSALYAAAALLFVANVFNLGADLGAMAQAARLIFPGAGFVVLVVFFAGISLLLEIFFSYRTYSAYLKYLAIILFAYVASAIMSGIDWRHIAIQAVIPNMHFTKQEFLMVAAILGTTISPYLFFWQTSQEVEEGILHGKTTIAARRATDPEEIRSMRQDVWTGMFISNMVMFFIVASAAATLWSHGITNIKTAAEAAIALRPFAGDAAYVLFTLGIIGTGLLTVPILAGSASYAISESFKWREGLFRKFRNAQAFYGVIIVATVIGILINLVGIDPIKALIWSAILNGVIAPIILFFIVDISRRHRIMGEFANSRLTTAVGWMIVMLMAAAATGAILSL